MDANIAALIVAVIGAYSAGLVGIDIATLVAVIGADIAGLVGVVICEMVLKCTTISLFRPENCITMSFRIML